MDIEFATTRSSSSTRRDRGVNRLSPLLTIESWGLLLLIFIPSCATKTDKRPGDEFDAGAVFSFVSERLVHKFKVTNTTSRTVQILGEFHSCDCTRIDLEKTTLVPGASVIMTMGLNVPRTYEKRQLTCIVKTDHPDYPEWAYHLTYECFPQARIVPTQVKLDTSQSNRLENGKPETDVYLEVYTTPGLEPLPAPIDQEVPPGVLVEFDRKPIWQSSTKGVRRARYGIRVGLADTSLSHGSFAQPLNLRLDNGFVSSTMIVWSITGSVLATPSHLHFGMVSPGGSPSVRSILIRSKDARPFVLLSAQSDSRAITIEMPDVSQASARSEHILKLLLLPDASMDQRSFSGYVRVVTDIDKSNEVQIPWSAFVRRSGMMGN